MPVEETTAQGFLPLLYLSSLPLMGTLRQNPDMGLASPTLSPPAQPGPRGRRQSRSAHCTGPNFSSHLLRGSRVLCPFLLPPKASGWEGPRKRSPQLRGSPVAFLLNAIRSHGSAFVLSAEQQPLHPTQTNSSVQQPPGPVTWGESSGGSEGHAAYCILAPGWLPLPNAQSNGCHAVPLVDTDPHFIIHVPQKEDTLCFNINEEPGVVLSLVQDPDTGMATSHPPASRGKAPCILPWTGQRLGPPLPTPRAPEVTWLASTCLFLTLSTCGGPGGPCSMGRAPCRHSDCVVRGVWAPSDGSCCCLEISNNVY